MEARALGMIRRFVCHQPGGKLFQVSRMFCSDTDDVLLKKTNNILVITLNRPKALNALNVPMVRIINKALKDIHEHKSAELVIIKSNSDKAFCAGGDVLAVSKSYKTGGTIHKDFFYEEYIGNHMIGTLPVPYVALIHGITMGGGCGLSINGRFRVATEKTLLAMPETALGLFPDVGGTYFLSRLPNNYGLFLALTGFRLKGADVFHSGMATHYINSSDLTALEHELTSLSKPTNDDVDALIKKFQPSNVPAFSLQSNIETIKKCFSGDSYEQVVKNLEADGSDFAKTQLKDLAKMSPISLKVTFRQIKVGEKMKFADVFPLEYRLTQKFCADKDFHEGCRAILIDKDRNPKWQPSTLAQVTDKTVDDYFSPLSADLEMKPLSKL